MTTIAWDGKTLAADTQLTGGNRKLRSRKLWRITRKGKSPILYGFCGSASMGIAVRDWLIEGMDPDNKPKLDKEWSGLLVVDDKVFEMESSLTPIEVMENVYGIGSGSDYAMGAMACGKTAAESIVIASVFDPGTNDKVETVTAEEPTRAKKA